MNSLTNYNSQDTKIAGKEDVNVYLAQEWIHSPNAPIPSIYFPNAQYPLPFYQTRDSLADVERYKAFIDNSVARFRRSRAYKGYKSYLMMMGLDRCQINGNIDENMATIEMHHNFLSIWDITMLVSQHLLNTVGRCTTFDVVAILIQEHRANNIPIVMLSETAHQLYHDDPDFYIPLSMTFGQWWNLLYKFRYGITLDIAYKTVKYIGKCQRNNELTDLSYYQLSDNIRSWGDYNEYIDRTTINNTLHGGYIDSTVYEYTTYSSRNAGQSGTGAYDRTGDSSIQLFG